MIKEPLTIIIKGKTCSGKTTLAAFLKQKLEGYGSDVNIIDCIDDIPAFDKNKAPLFFEVMREVFSDRKINIITQQVNREAKEDNHAWKEEK